MKRIWVFCLSGITIAGGLIIWSMGSSETPEWKEVQQLQKEIRTSMESDPEQSSESEADKESRENLRWEKMAEYRKKLNALPEKLQKAAKEQMGGMFVSRMEQRIDLVLSLPPRREMRNLINKLMNGIGGSQLGKKKTGRKYESQE